MTARRGPVIVRDCHHTRVRHEHGTPTAYKRDRCRCTPCSDAQNVEDRLRRLANHLGTPRRIDAGPVRAHIRALQAAGIGYRQLGELAGVSPSTVLKIAKRDPNRRDGRPQQKVTPAIAEKLLAVTPTLGNVSDGGLIDATGTLRRIHALHAAGWSRRALAAWMDVQHNALAQLEHTRRVSGLMARTVRDAYDALWDQAPSAATPQQRAGITVTLRAAAERGWVMPAMWDDDTIDDPAAEPAPAAAVAVAATDRLDEVLFLARSGVSLYEASRRAGYSSWANAQSIAYRHDHPVARIAERLELERAA